MDKKINESYLDNVESGDIMKNINKDSFDENYPNIDNMYSIMWRPQYGCTLRNISKNHQAFIENCIDNFKYVDDVCIMISGQKLYATHPDIYIKYGNISNIDESVLMPIPLFEYINTYIPEKGFSKQMEGFDMLHIYFNIDVRQKNDPVYAINCIVELSKLIILLAEALYLPSDYINELSIEPGGRQHKAPNGTIYWEYDWNHNGIKRVLDLKYSIYSIKNHNINQDLAYELCGFVNNMLKDSSTLR